MNNKKDVQIKITSYPKETPMMINFVKEGQPVPHKEKITKSILDEAKEWEVTVDLKKKIVLPNVIQTKLRPDIVLSYMTSKVIMMIELTVP